MINKKQLTLFSNTARDGKSISKRSFKFCNKLISGSLQVGEREKKVNAKNGEYHFRFKPVLLKMLTISAYCCSA